MTTKRVTKTAEVTKAVETPKGKSGTEVERDQLQALLEKPAKEVEVQDVTTLPTDTATLMAMDAALTAEAAEAFLAEKRADLDLAKRQDAELNPELRKPQIEKEIARIDRALEAQK